MVKIHRIGKYKTPSMVVVEFASQRRFLDEEFNCVASVIGEHLVTLGMDDLDVAEVYREIRPTGVIQNYKPKGELPAGDPLINNSHIKVSLVTGMYRDKAAAGDLEKWKQRAPALRGQIESAIKQLPVTREDGENDAVLSCASVLVGSDENGIAVSRLLPTHSCS